MNFPKTLRLFTFEGIDLKISVSFQIFLCLISVMTFIANASIGLINALAISIFVVTMTLVVYCFVTIHEYGHALAAKRLGYKVRDISLYPMAGLASVDGEWHKRPWDEFIITFWGPFTNVIMALYFYALLSCYPSDSPETFDKILIEFAAHINTALVVFNLIPAYPMDGGRILRSCIGMFCKDWWTATLWSTRISFVCGVIAIPLGFYFEHAIAGCMVAFMGLMMSQLEKEHLQTHKEIEDLEKQRDESLKDMMESWAEDVWPNDLTKQDEFKKVMAAYREFVRKFTVWSVEKKISKDIFSSAITHLFCALKDEKIRQTIDEIIKTDEESVFKELEDAATEWLKKKEKK